MTDDHALVVDLPALRPAILNALRLLVETTVVPAVLFALLLAPFGLAAALGAACGWLWLVVAARWFATRSVPTTLLLSVGLVSARAAVSLGAKSALVFLLEPILMAVVTGLLFVGSAMAGKPLTSKLAKDFVHLPEHVVARCGVRAMFRDLAVMWGISRIIGGALGFALLHADAGTAAVGRGAVGPLFTVITAVMCVLWARRCLMADGIQLRRHRKVTALPAVAVA